MMYPFMTLTDETEIVHSEAYYDNGKERVKVYIERPIHNGFQSAECYLPDYEWKNIDGFTDEDMTYFRELVQSLSHVIIRLAREGGFNNAANLQAG